MKRLVITLLAIAAFIFSPKAQILSPLSMTDCEGNSVELTDLSPRLVTFYSDDCMPCRRMMDNITWTENDVFKTLDEEATLFAVCWKSPNVVVAYAKDDAEKSKIIKRFDERCWNRKKLYFVSDSAVLRKYVKSYGINCIPAILEINRNGKISNIFMGMYDSTVNSIFNSMLNIALEH